MKLKHPNLVWILTLKASFENSSDFFQIYQTICNLIKDENNIRMRKILLSYLKSLLILDKSNNESSLRTITYLMSIEDIQLNFSKNQERVDIIPLINGIRWGKAGKFCC